LRIKIKHLPVDNPSLLNTLNNFLVATYESE
jgi:hypothetical protein